MNFPDLPPALLPGYSSILTDAITNAGISSDDIILETQVADRLGRSLCDHGAGAALVHAINVANTVAIGASIILLTQNASAAQASVVTTAATTSSPYGFSQAQADALVTLTNEMRRVLILKGFMKGSA